MFLQVRDVRAAAERVNADLRRTSGPSWRLHVANDLLLRVKHGARQATIHVDRHIEDWPSDHIAPDQVDSTLSGYADEAVARALDEVLEGW